MSNLYIYLGVDVWDYSNFPQGLVGRIDNMVENGDFLLLTAFLEIGIDTTKN